MTGTALQRTLVALKQLHAGEGVRAMEHDLMSKLGPGAKLQA